MGYAALQASVDIFQVLAGFTSKYFGRPTAHQNRTLSVVFRSREPQRGFWINTTPTSQFTILARTIQ